MNKDVIKSLFAKIHEGALAVDFWDGETVNFGTDTPRVKVKFHKLPPLGLNLSDPMISLGEAYVDEVVDIEGEFDELMRILHKNKDIFTSAGASQPSILFKTLNDLALKLRQQQNIKHHYDLGDDFYSLWLDKTMSYSCAYFKQPSDTLDQAQQQKINYILQKLNLQAGETLLDIGSGWGWLIIEAARKYNVKALGITLSENQYQTTKKRIEELGLSNLVQVKILDYLDLADGGYQCDKVVSVGMFEHVGKENLGKYLLTVSKLLAPGGLSLLHTITAPKEAPVNSWITKYIFPGGYIPSLREIVWQLPDYDFHLLHAESLRMHYAMTLDRWYANFTNQADYLEEKYGKKFVRMWGLYLQGCAANFRVSDLDIHQILFSKGLNNNLPLTYERLYPKK